MEKSVKESFEILERAQEQARSSQPRLQKQSVNDANFFSSVMRWTQSSSDIEPPYRPDSRERDKWLTTFWQREPHWAGVISQVNMIDSNRGWTLTGGRNQVLRFIPVLRDADDGMGWRQYASQQSTSYYTTDMGGLTEIGRDGSEGPMRAIYHLDPTKCYLTGDRDAPLKYDSNKNPWKPEDFFRLVSMKSIREEMKGLGFCATSRILDMSKIMLAVYNHELESLGSRAPKGLMLLQNISQGQWDEAMKVREAKMDTNLQKYYNSVAVIAQSGVDNIDAKLVALSQLPDGFSLEMFTNLLMYAYALCIGYDPTEFWPVQAGQLGRGRETDIQHRKGTGKGGLNFMLAMQEAMQNELPETIHFEFEQRDQEGVLLDAKVAQAWADVVMTLRGKQRSTTPGPDDRAGDGTTTLDGSESVISLEEARTLLAMYGTIPGEWVRTDEEAKATDVKEIEREKLLENDAIRRAIYQFPTEPILQYAWSTDNPRGKTKVLFREAQEITKATRFSVVKPIALIPEFGQEDILEAVEEKNNFNISDEDPRQFYTQKRVENGLNIYRGDTPPFTVTIRDKRGSEVDVSAATEIVYFIYGRDKNKPLVQKELGRGIDVNRSVITILFDPEDTLSLLGIYSHTVKITDDLGRIFTVFSGEMAVLKEYVDA